MRVFCHIPREGWIVDRIGEEFKASSCHDVSFVDLNCDVIWLLGGWCWKQIPLDVLATRPVVCMLHHEVPSKFVGQRLHDFKERDAYVDAYNVPCEQTRAFIAQHTDKPIHVVGYWLNAGLWDGSTLDRAQCRYELGIADDEFVVGSFQRDTEGTGDRVPKLEKGPDVFCDVIEACAAGHTGWSGPTLKNVHVLLNAWRRDYVIDRLTRVGIRHTYIELPPIDVVRRMYAALDLYIVSSRYEGGPQALLEAAALRIPIISTSCGMARDVLPASCVYNDLIDGFLLPTLDDVEQAHAKAMSFSMMTHVSLFDEMLENVVSRFA